MKPLPGNDLKAASPGNSSGIEVPRLTYEEAVGIVIDRIRPLPDVTLPVLDARGMVLAAPVYARWDLPTADNSAMDGYAFHGDGHGPDDILPVIGTATAGAPFDGPVAAGTAVKIMTGGVLPPRCDTVVPREEVETNGHLPGWTKEAT